MSVSDSTKQPMARDLKHRILTCLHKLSDRDTHSAAASELEYIAVNLSSDALSSFLSSISATDSSDKSPVRRQCVRLISVLSEHHGNSLSPHLSKLLSAVVRRLRDPDSSVRSACVAASLTLSSQITSPPFNSITKPFLESLFTEQDSNAQNGAALCLAAIIEGSRTPDVTSLRKLFPKLEKLAKSENFKAKAPLLALIGSIVEVKGVLNSCNRNVLKNLIKCLMEFLSSEDWAARKAAADALMKITAAVEKDDLSEYKASCLKTFELKRFDKVKAVRESMNQMIEAWKDIPDPADEASPSPESRGSSKENGSDARYPPSWKVSQEKRSPFANNGNGIGNRTAPAMFKKLDHRKPDSSHLSVEGKGPSDGDARPGIRKALFSDNHEMVIKAGGDVVDISRYCGDSEELSMIRKQLFQIENQQSNMLDLLQRMIGNSEDGIRSLEARVHGLELALDDISFDLGISRRVSGGDNSVCCSLPGTGFLSSKLRGCYSNSSVSAIEMNRGRFLDRMNPVAEIPGCSVGLLEASST